MVLEELSAYLLKESTIPKQHSFTHHTVLDSETGLQLIRLFYKDALDPARSIQIAVSPEYGSNILQFKVGDRDIFYTDKQAIKEGKWTGCYVLWPLPNRYDRNGRKEYEFEGQVVSLEEINRKEGNRSLIHGLVDDQVWQAAEPTASTDGVSFQTSIEITAESPLYTFFPFKSRITMQYTLRSDGLEVDYQVENNDQKNMPSVFALHPYYALLGGREDTLVRIPARSVMKATEELLPTGELQEVRGTKYDLNQPQPVKDLWFDDVWTDLENNQYAFVEYRTIGLRISHITSDDFTHCVLYTQMEAEKGFICLEPQTGSTNAINLDDQARRQHDEKLANAAHVIVVKPGKRHTGRVKFAVEFID